MASPTIVIDSADDDESARQQEKVPGTQTPPTEPRPDLSSSMPAESGLVDADEYAAESARPSIKEELDTINVRLLNLLDSFRRTSMGIDGFGSFLTKRRSTLLKEEKEPLGDILGLIKSLSHEKTRDGLLVFMEDYQDLNRILEEASTDREDVLVKIKDWLENNRVDLGIAKSIFKEAIEADKDLGRCIDKTMANLQKLRDLKLQLVERKVDKPSALRQMKAGETAKGRSGSVKFSKPASKLWADLTLNTSDWKSMIDEILNIVSDTAGADPNVMEAVRIRANALKTSFTNKEEDLKLVKKSCDSTVTKIKQMQTKNSQLWNRCAELKRKIAEAEGSSQGTEDTASSDTRRLQKMLEQHISSCAEHIRALSEELAYQTENSLQEVYEVTIKEHRMAEMEEEVAKLLGQLDKAQRPLPIADASTTMAVTKSELLDKHECQFCMCHETEEQQTVGHCSTFEPVSDIPSKRHSDTELESPHLVPPGRDSKVQTSHLEDFTSKRPSDSKLLPTGDTYQSKDSVLRGFQKLSPSYAAALVGIGQAFRDAHTSTAVLRDMLLARKPLSTCKGHLSAPEKRGSGSVKSMIETASGGGAGRADWESLFPKVDSYHSKVQELIRDITAVAQQSARRVSDVTSQNIHVLLQEGMVRNISDIMDRTALALAKLKHSENVLLTAGVLRASVCPYCHCYRRQKGGEFEPGRPSSELPGSSSEERGSFTEPACLLYSLKRKGPMLDKILLMSDAVDEVLWDFKQEADGGQEPGGGMAVGEVGSAECAEAFACLQKAKNKLTAAAEILVTQPLAKQA